MGFAATILLWLFLSVAAYFFAPLLVQNAYLSAAAWGFIGLMLFAFGRFTKALSSPDEYEPQSEYAPSPPSRIVTPVAFVGFSFLSAYWRRNPRKCGDQRAVRTVAEELNRLAAGADEKDIQDAVGRGIERALGQAAIDFDWQALDDRDSNW